MYSHTARKQQQVSTKSLCMTAVCMAVVFLMTFMPRIPIPFGYAHLGDAVIFLLILFLPRRQAGFAASVGSAFSDLLGGFPIWIVPTLVIKWVMVEIVFRMAAMPAARERSSVLSLRFPHGCDASSKRTVLGLVPADAAGLFCIGIVDGHCLCRVRRLIIRQRRSRLAHDAGTYR